MGEKKPQTRNIKYQGLSLPVTVLDEVKEHIAKYPGYTSVTDFVRQAIRVKIARDELRRKKDISDIAEQFSNLEKEMANFVTKEDIQKLFEKMS